MADFDTPEENDTLSDILLYHVFSGSVASSAVTDGMIATMANGDKAKFGVNGATVTIGDATVTSADVQASNGIIHVIDKVLMPPVDIPSVAQTTGIHNSLVLCNSSRFTYNIGRNGSYTIRSTDQALPIWN